MIKILLLLLLSFNLNASLSDHRARKISIGSKTYEGNTDYVFRDALGREVYLRGWNVSGAVKLKSMGYIPFKTTADAEVAFRELRAKTGSNVIRFTIGWEGVHPDVDVIDYNYLKNVKEQIQEATKNGIYVLLDYHQDLYSRHLWNEKSKYTGNGAPSWIVPDELYEDERCLICFHWGINNVFNKPIKKAYVNFWNDAAIPTKKGTRFVQTEFLYQLGKVFKYLKENLSEEEFDYILGINPMNEPIDGGMQGLSSDQWYKEKIWAFNFRVKKVMDENGWNDKLAFPEPLVFWNTNSPFIKNDRPYYKELLDNPPKGFVFNTHFYDAKRMSISLSSIKNGSYIGYMDHIKFISRKMQMPPFLSEFGMWIENGRVKNQARMIKADYQGMEISKEVNSNYAEFYGPVISGTQWHWDVYHDTHKEPFNGTDTIITEGDAWNHENFSVVTNDGNTYTTPDQFSIERVFPRRVQGDILHFHYNDLSHDGRKGNMKWASIRLNGENYLNNNRFFFMAWKGNGAKGPTEIFLPKHIELKDLVVVTEKFVKKGFDKNSESMIMLDHGGKVLSITNSDLDINFALVVYDPANEYDQVKLEDIQAGLVERVINNKKSPVYLTGKVRIDSVPAVPVGNRSFEWLKLNQNTY